MAMSAEPQLLMDDTGIAPPPVLGMVVLSDRAVVPGWAKLVGLFDSARGDGVISHLTNQVQLLVRALSILIFMFLC